MTEREPVDRRQIPLDNISPTPRNPREHVEPSKIEDLAESIDEQGLLQPVLVRPVGDGYELVHGERRLRAVERLGRETIGVEVRDLTDREALEVSITENLQREDVNPLAEARAYQSLIDEFDLTQAEAADRLGKSQGHISNALKLLNLPDILQRDILHKIFSPWQARTLAGVWGEYHLRDLALDWDLSVSDIRGVIEDLEAEKRYVSVMDTWPRDAFDGELSDHNGEIVPPEFGTDHAGHDLSHGLRWADRTLPVDVGIEYDADPGPIIYEWVGQQIVLGYHRLQLSEWYDYTGEFDVQIEFRREMFEPPTQDAPTAAGGEADA